MSLNELNDELNQVLSYHLKKGYTSCSYAIMVDGKLIANDSLGTKGGSDPRPADTDSTYNVASISKIYTTVAVLQLVEKGRLDLDRPVVDYLPEFRTLSGDYGKITLRHCLCHQSGLPGTMWNDFSLSDQSECDYYRDALRFYSLSALKAAPGEYSVYCNDGFTIAEMCVAAVCDEKSFSEYCRIHITDPIGAPSSRFARSYNPDYKMIAQGKGPAELVTAQGLGGLTTSMKDLAKFGCEFLAGRSKLLTKASRQEMTRSWGRTFLKKDTSTGGYGLGWDNVSYHYPEYDLGENAMRKGGASFQFASQFLIVPKYKAVLAFSQTYDCGLDAKPLVLRMLALALLRTKGINITRYKPIPDSYPEKYGGPYLQPGQTQNIHMHGVHCYVTTENSRGDVSLAMPPMGFTGRCFTDEAGRKLHFEKAKGETFALREELGVISPFAQKAVDRRPVAEKTWENRLGKTYINVSVSPVDEIIVEMMAGFVLRPYRDFRSIMVLAFQYNDGPMDCPVRAESADVANGFLLTPDNPSRDLVTPVFFVKDGIEYCEAASYRYRDADSLPLYDGRGFEERGEETAAYRFGYPLTKLPEIPEGRRILVLNSELKPVYDSLMSDSAFSGCDKGYLLLC